MNILDISKKLKKLRKINNLKAKQVVNQMGKYNQPISEKTLYKWEQGSVLIDINSLRMLCHIYNVTIQEFFESDEQKLFSLNILEENFIEMIRENEYFRQALTFIIKTKLYKREDIYV